MDKSVSVKPRNVSESDRGSVPMPKANMATRRVNRVAASSEPNSNTIDARTTPASKRSGTSRP